MMSQNNTQYVNWEGLQYYDQKSKQYIDDKIAEVQKGAATESDLTKVEEKVSALATDVSNNTIRIDSVKEHIDEDEADILDLQAQARSFATEVGVIKTELKYKVGAEVLANYATKEFVEDKIVGANLDNYYTKTQVDNLVRDIQTENIENTAKIENIDKTLIRLEEDIDSDHTKIENLMVAVENKAPEHHKHCMCDITDYEVPDLDNYATKEFVEDKIAKIPQPDLSDYYTKTESDNNFAVKSELESKSDAILFNEEEFVRVTMGGFTTGDKISGLTIKEILTKLLKVTKSSGGSSMVVDSIIADQIPMYILSDDGTFVSYEFRYETLTTDQADAESEENYFYQIVDDTEKVIQSGYQILTINQEIDWLTIALHKEVTQFHVEVYDAVASKWATPQWEFTPNSNYTCPEGYNCYSVPELYEIPSGDGLVIRIVIEN